MISEAGRLRNRALFLEASKAMGEATDPSTTETSSVL